MEFSTFDADHDNWNYGIAALPKYGNCAAKLYSGFWWDHRIHGYGCGWQNINGPYNVSDNDVRIYWSDLRRLKKTQMMIRPAA